MWKKMKRKLISYTLPKTTTQSQWIKDISLWPEIIELQEENVNKILKGVSIGKDFLEKIPKAQAMRQKNKKWDYI